jgi:virginiamycin A acetyltransferase
MIFSHPSAQISDKADIEVSKRGTVIRIGEGTLIDAFVKIKTAGGSGDVIIGDYVYINSGCVLYTGNGIVIGNNTLIAANCTLAPTNHEFSKRSALIRQQGFRPSKGGIIIESDVWIGANCTILDGAILREGCVIGAGSIVSGEIVPFTIHAGNPLRQIGVRND